MDIINVIGQQVAKWQAEEACGLCWEYVPSGRSDYFNTVKLRDGNECCAYVAVLGIKNRAGIANATRMPDTLYCDWDVRLFAGIPSRLDLQFYNESPNCPPSEGKWCKYIDPISCCLSGCGLEMDLCNIHNCQGLETTVEPVKWIIEMKMNYQDLNLDGWMIDATFREWLSGKRNNFTPPLDV